jgi:hypothetical protein
MYGRAQRIERLIALGLVQLPELLTAAAQGAAGLALAEGSIGRQQVDELERLEESQRIGKRPKATERMERLERTDELGLVVCVLVAASRILHRHAGAFFLGKALAGLRAARMRLQAECLLRSQDLEQEGQPIAEARARLGAERPVGLGLDPIEQVALFAREARGSSRMGPDPEFGLGRFARRPALKLGDRRVRAPRVGLNAVLQDLDRAHGAERTHSQAADRMVLNPRSLAGRCRSRAGSAQRLGSCLHRLEALRSAAWRSNEGCSASCRQRCESRYGHWRVACWGWCAIA